MADLDLGTEPIDTQAVVSNVPTEEKVCGFSLEMTRSDVQPMQIKVASTERDNDIIISPGTFGEAKWEAAWGLAKAMLQTDEGKQFILKVLRGALKEKPLALKTQVVEVENV